MEILINELSIHEQFSSVDDFASSLIDTIRMYQAIPDKKFTISKKSDVWSYKPTKQDTLNDILNIKGNDKITKFKSVLSSFITKEPFWDLNQKHSDTDEYICEHTSEKSNYSIAEACERDQLVLSFSSETFTICEISVCKNNSNNYCIKNFYSKYNFLDYLINAEPEYFIYFCQKQFENHKVDFVSKNNNYQIGEFLDSLNKTEKIDVINEIKKMILDYLDNAQPLPENISRHLRDSIFELRVNFRNKICRLLYFYGSDNTIVFTHGFIKKTQKTPNSEINRAVSLREEYQNI